MLVKIHIRERKTTTEALEFILMTTEAVTTQTSTTRMTTRRKKFKKSKSSAIGPVTVYCILLLSVL